MKIIKRILFGFLPNEKRRLPRYAVAKSSQCFVKSSRQERGAPVYLNDISASGLGFFSKSPCFDIGDQVEVFLERDSRALTADGRIASQRIYYPDNSSDLKHAIFRYSVQFGTPLDPKTVDNYRTD